MNQNLKRVKGFSLTEMIVVLAIIGVLAGIMAPSMIEYYRSSRIKDANADAKMVYSAAQTEVQKYFSMDRIAEESDKSLFKDLVIISYDEATGSIQYSKQDSDALSTPADSDLAQCQAIVNAVNNTVSDAENVNWAIYIENYIVKASVSAETSNTTYVGMCSAGKLAATERSDQPYSLLFPSEGNSTNILVSIADSNYDAQPASTPSDENSQAEDSTPES